MIKGFSHKRYEVALFEANPIGIIYADLEGNFTEVNNSFAELVGYKRESLIGKNFKEITFDGDIESDEDTRKEALNAEFHNKSIRYYKRYIKKNGNLVWVELTAIVIKDKEGKSEHWVAFVNPLPNGGRFVSELGVDDKISVRPTIGWNEFMKDNWKFFLILSVATLLIAGEFFYLMFKLLSEMGIPTIF